MTIAQRVIALIAAALLGLAVLTGVSSVQMNEVYKEANYANDNVVPSIETLHRASIAYYQIRTFTLYHILSSHVTTTNSDGVKRDLDKKSKTRSLKPKSTSRITNRWFPAPRINACSNTRRRFYPTMQKDLNRFWPHRGIS